MKYRRQVLENLTVEEHCLTVADLLEGPIAKYIALAANNCGYSGTSEELIVNYFHTFFF